MFKNLNKTLVFFVLNAVVAFGGATLSLADDAAAPVGATAAPGQPPQPSFGQPGFGMSFVPFVLMFGVIYFLMIRPQQKRLKEQQAMVNALKQGDEILTASGILGKVTGVTEKVVTVEVADNVRVKMLKSQVSQVIKGQLKDNLA